MTWSRLDANYPTHPKLVAAGLEAMGLDAAGICHANNYHTDGFVADGMLAVIACGHPHPHTVAARLVEVGRWNRDPVRGGYWIHDFLEYNTSKAEWEAAIETRRAISRKGGEASARARSKAAEPTGQPSGSTARSTGRFNRTVNRAVQPTGQPVGQPYGSTFSASEDAPAESGTDRSTARFNRAVNRAVQPDGSETNHLDASDDGPPPPDEDDTDTVQPRGSTGRSTARFNREVDRAVEPQTRPVEEPPPHPPRTTDAERRPRSEGGETSGQPPWPPPADDELDPRAEELAQRLATLWPNRPAKLAGARAQVAKALRYFDAAFVDETIGSVLGLDAKPRDAVYLAHVLANRAEERGILPAGHPGLDDLRNRHRGGA